MKPDYELRLPPVGEWGWWRSTLAPPATWADLAGEGAARQAMRTTLTSVQEGRCGLCLSQPRHLVLDHDHETGLARGMLCRACNSHEGYGWPGPTLRAYRADPPAAGAGWVWDMDGLVRAAWTMVGYGGELVLSPRLLRLTPVVTGLVRAHQKRQEQAAIAIMQRRLWTEPGRSGVAS